MRPQKAHRPAAVALLQLGPEVHSALQSAALRSGHSKSEFARLAILGAVKAQDGYWERLLMDVLRTIPELVQAAADAKLLTNEEAENIVKSMDDARSRLYGELDRIDGLSSIHWAPTADEPVRSYEEVMRIRASREELVHPEIAPLECLEARFIELANQRFREKEKAKVPRHKSRRSVSKSQS